MWYNEVMVAALRQIVTVGEGGRIEVRSPELKEGERAEVIVLLEEQPISIAHMLAALDKLQESLKLDDTKTEQWIRAAREEREAFGPRA